MSYVISVVISWIPRKDALTMEITNNFLHDDNNVDISTMTECVLEQISTGKAFHHGQKGSMIMCGGMSNYTSGSTIIDELMPLFEKLKDNGCFYDSDNIICLSRDEQSKDLNVIMVDCNKLDIYSEIINLYWSDD